ncbi:MAG: class I SAM-dependent methyltransferase [Proteobacteria bacterium]|nr:class I SAM-dependent methyltransferase [Pseudomonadota bacterium]
MKFKSEFLENYTAQAPLALAFERVMECRILSRQTFERPILDIGCGEGLFANVLFAEKIETGIDPNAREIERAKEFGGYDELIECFGDAIPKPDGAYRTVFSNSVVEHIPQLTPVLREAFRLLAPGGRLYLTVPSDRFDEYSLVSQALGFCGLTGLQARFRDFYNRFWAHYHFYAPARWAEIVTSCGFEVVELHTYGPRYVCLMDDTLTPLGLAARFTKGYANRWTLVPGLRRVLLAPVLALARTILKGAERCDAGGLVFIAARKP